MAINPDAESIADQALTSWEAGDTDRAEALWHLAAAMGSSRAKVNLGRNRMDEADYDAAAVWFLAAVEDGDPEAAILMAGIGYLRGDAEEERRWSWIAADLGYIPILHQLAVSEPDPDPQETFNVALMLRAVEAGSGQACAMMAIRAFNREEYQECVTWGLRAFNNPSSEEDADAAQDARLHSVVASAYYSMGNYGEALRHYDIAFDLDRDAVSLPDSALDELRELVAGGTQSTQRSHTFSQPHRNSPQSVSEHSRETTSTTNTPQTFCTHCGTKFSGGEQKFCSECGQRR